MADFEIDEEAIECDYDDLSDRYNYFADAFENPSQYYRIQKTILN